MVAFLMMAECRTIRLAQLGNLVEYSTNSSSTSDELRQLSQGDLCPARTCSQALEQLSHL